METTEIVTLSEDTSSTSSTSSSSGDIPPLRIFICSVLFVVVIITLIGNIIVIISIVIDKNLRRSNFNLYVANLAFTDVSVALMAMSFYTFDVLLGYWPFGQVLCGIWIFFDYGMTFASVFTLVAISLDRFWSVTWSMHYRQHNTRTKTAVAIALVWCGVLAVWLAPCVVDRLKYSEPRVCKWEPSNNRGFVIFVAIVGHHTPCLLMVFSYVKVFSVMRKNKVAMSKHAHAPQASVITDAASMYSAIKESSTSNHVRAAPDATTSGAGTPGGSHYQQQQQQQQQPRKTVSKNERERRIFITLSYIIFSYLVCWVPFHVVFDVSAINPDLVPEGIYTLTFWLTYFNSTLNPILYAFSSNDFRVAFKRVVRCQCK